MVGPVKSSRGGLEVERLRRKLLYSTSEGSAPRGAIKILFNNSDIAGGALVNNVQNLVEADSIIQVGLIQFNNFEVIQ